MLTNKGYKIKREYLKELALPIAIFIILALFLIFGLKAANDSAKKEGLIYLQSALSRASTTCYAVEGMYAPDVAYLEDHYGVIIDHSKFIVHYEAFASNITPTIKVIDLSAEGGGE
jgi:hypothetical protein